MSVDESARTAATRLAVARHAARLFWERGVAATTGDDIAHAAGLSTRTVWRHFRSKESSIEPLLTASAYGFVESLSEWSPSASLEDFLDAWGARPSTPQQVDDELLAARLIVLSAAEPDIRVAWLMACSEAERRLHPFVAERLSLPPGDPRVALCAAGAVAGARVANEEIATAALVRGEAFTTGEVYERLAAAIRACAAESGFADPVGRQQGSGLQRVIQIEMASE